MTNSEILEGDKPLTSYKYYSSKKKLLKMLTHTVRGPSKNRSKNLLLTSFIWGIYLDFLENLASDINCLTATLLTRLL